MESPTPTNQPTTLVWQLVLSGDAGKDKPFAQCEAICVWLARNTSGYLVGEHPSKEYRDPKTNEMKVKGIHCHILIEGLKVSRTALEKEIKKYVSKGKGAILTCWKKDHERASAWIMPSRDEFEAVDKKSTPVKKVKTTFQHCQQIVEYLDKWLPNMAWSAKEIVSAIIKYCRENKLPLSAYKARDWYDCVIMISNPEKYQDTIVNLINKRDGYVY